LRARVRVRVRVKVRMRVRSAGGNSSNFFIKFSIPLDWKL
jgi:hypothetical protein